jgi:hypothetical protein
MPLWCKRSAHHRTTAVHLVSALLNRRVMESFMADRQRQRDRSDRSHGKRDRLDFDHHREERHRSMDASLPGHDRSSSADRAHGNADYGWRDEGSSRSVSSGSQEFGRQAYDRGYGDSPYGAREWSGTDTWRVPGPFAGRGPRGYQRSDDRIREELNDRLTAHGFIDATDIECRVHNGDVTLSGFVDSREAKRAAHDVAQGIQGVHDVHNNLQIRSREDAERISAPNAPRPVERSRTTTSSTWTRRSGAKSK